MPPPKKKPQKQEQALIITGSASERASAILASADQVLKRVDCAPIFSKLQVREFPSFELDEVEFGPELGTGGYSRVQEVTNVRLLTVVSSSSSSKEVVVDDDAAADDDDDESSSQNDNNNKNNEPSTTTQQKQQQKEDEDAIDFIAQIMRKKAGVDGDEQHYDVGTARETIAQKCVRVGNESRYAVKKLKVELDEVARARGALDLAIEIRYLSVLWHPNIVKLRGISKTKTTSMETFLLMDRLYGTLDSTFVGWEQLQAMNQGCCGGGGGNYKNDPAAREFLKSRLLVAYDLTCAFHYLHEAKLIYRDIKPGTYEETSDTPFKQHGSIFVLLLLCLPLLQTAFLTHKQL
jgi:serine/threonine protein kinase